MSRDSQGNPFTFIVPCFNEQQRIDPEEWVAFIDYTQSNLVFVNDGSTDETQKVLEKIWRSRPRNIKIVSFPKNSGKAEAVRKGLNKALTLFGETQWIGYLDADAAYMAADVVSLSELSLKSNYDIVMGSRVRLLGRNINRTPYRHIIGRLVASYLGRGKTNFPYDSQCGLKIFRVSNHLREALDIPFESRWFVDIELMIRLKERVKVAITEEPLQKWMDSRGSHIKIRNYGKILVELIRIRRKVRNQWT